MAFTVSELLSVETFDAVKQKFLSKLQSAKDALGNAVNLPITDWYSGGIARTFLELLVDGVWDATAALIPTIVKSGLIDFAEGDWLDLVGEQLYQVTRRVASHTTGTIRLTCAGGAGPYTINPGQLWFVGAGGNRYNNTTGGVLASGGTLDVTVKSESPNHSVATSSTDTAPLVNYTDASATITQFSPSLPGVTCTNPAPTFSAVSKIGTSTGTVTPSGTPSGGSHRVTVRIDSQGQVGVATWSYSVDGGAFVSAGTAAAAVVGFGITVTLANGSVNPSFYATDRFLFDAPGTWIITQGTDKETDPAYRTRCKARWPSLGALPTVDAYDLMVRLASDQVTQTLVASDPTVNNKVLIYIAGQGGALPSPVIATAQAYVDPRVGLTDYPVVGTPANRALNLAGATVLVKSAYKTAAQLGAQAAISSYFSSAGINPTIRLAELVELIMDQEGVVDITGLTINGVAANLVLPVTPGAFEVPAWAEVLATVLAWQETA
jgi:hypothetical protein